MSQHKQKSHDEAEESFITDITEINQLLQEPDVFRVHGNVTLRRGHADSLTTTAKNNERVTSGVPLYPNKQQSCLFQSNFARHNSYNARSDASFDNSYPYSQSATPQRTASRYPNQYIFEMRRSSNGNVLERVLRERRS